MTSILSRNAIIFLAIIFSFATAQLYLAAGNSQAAASSPYKSFDSINFLFVGDWGHNVPANVSESGIAFEGSAMAKQVCTLN